MYLRQAAEPVSIHELGLRARTSGAIYPEEAARSYAIQKRAHEKRGGNPSEIGAKQIVESGARREIYRIIASLRKKLTIETTGKRGNVFYSIKK